MDELEFILIKGVFVFMACYVLNNNVDYYGWPLVTLVLCFAGQYQ